MKKILALLAFFLFLSPTLVLADYTVTSTATANPVDNLGYLAQPADATQLITIGAGTISSLVFSIKRIGSPAGSLQVDIETDSGGVPSGVSLGTASVNASAASTNCADFTFNFGSPPSVSAATTYWVVITSNDTLSSSNYYNTCGTSPHVTNFLSAYFNTVIWQTEDLTNRYSLTVTTAASTPSRFGILTFFGWW